MIDITTAKAIYRNIRLMQSYAFTSKRPADFFGADDILETLAGSDDANLTQARTKLIEAMQGNPLMAWKPLMRSVIAMEHYLGPDHC